MAETYQFKDYLVEPVYQQVTDSVADEIRNLWLEANVLSRAEAERRVKEVVLTARNENGELVGVNTVYRQDFLSRNNTYYFYRVFIRPHDRGVFGLRRFMSLQARQFLKEYRNPQGETQGVVIVNENRKLSRKGAKRMLERDGWTFWGVGPKGFDVWFVNFDGTTTAK